MPFFYSWPSGFEVSSLNGYVFHSLPDAQRSLHCVEEVICGRGVYPALDLVEDGRAVYWLEREKAVLKYNRVRHWKSRLRKTLGFLSPKGKYCLLDEFINLARLSTSGLVPRVYGYGYRRVFGLLRDEYLIIEFLDNSMSVDDALRCGAFTPGQLLPEIFSLFRDMLNQGFVHMDPHPKNIMIVNGGGLRLIDFECCAFDVLDKSFCMAFCLGYFYHFWFCRFMSESDYDAAVLGFIGEDPVGDAFWPVYERFKHRKVSRSARYQCFFSEGLRRAFVDESVKMAMGAENQGKSL